MNNRFKKGEMLGDYRVEGFIGAGGMGEVYKGVHTRLNRPAAIKVLNAGSLKDSLVTRFNNEARVHSTLQHPNIAALYDFQKINGRLCIFMEFIDGENLEDLIERRFYAVDEALAVFLNIVKAVSFTHSNGVIHRDIKSQNIKMTADGNPKLLDFGIAKDAASANLTSEGGVIGTPNYLAPEQLLGSGASAQTDVWALGILLYEMLTGRMPFQADTIGELCERIKSSHYASVEELNSAVPGQVCGIVEKCLSKDPKKRFQTAEEVSTAVSGALSSQYGESANGLSFLDGQKNAGSNGRRSLTLVFMGILCVFVLSGIAGFGIWAIAGSSETGADNRQGAVEITPKENDPDSTFPAFQDNESGVSTESIRPEMNSLESDTKEIKIDVIGGSAEVIRNGKTVGNTPFGLKAPDGTVVHLTLRKEGYADKDVLVDVKGSKSVYTFVMQAK